MYSFPFVQCLKMPRRKNWKRSESMMGVSNPMVKTVDGHFMDHREEESDLLFKNRKTSKLMPEESVLSKNRKTK